VFARFPGVLQAPPELQQSIEEGVNVTGEFCSLDATGKRVRERSMGEMEQVRHKNKHWGGVKGRLPQHLCSWGAPDGQEAPTLAGMPASVLGLFLFMGAGGGGERGRGANPQVLLRRVLHVSSRETAAHLMDVGWQPGRPAAGAGDKGPLEV
jgi:hypothetical protein